MCWKARESSAQFRRPVRGEGTRLAFDGVDNLRCLRRIGIYSTREQLSVALVGTRVRDVLGSMEVQNGMQIHCQIL